MRTSYISWIPPLSASLSRYLKAQDTIKKGGIKAHTIIKYDENIPCLVRYTSAATPDHILLKDAKLPKGSFITFNMGYVDYKAYQDFTDNQISYITKMKTNAVYHPQDEFDIPEQEDTGILQLKQNFLLKYFLGDNVNAIELQIWVVFIANLLFSVVKKQVKQQWAFSNMVTFVRINLMAYIHLCHFLENPQKAWLAVQKSRKKMTF